MTELQAEMESQCTQLRVKLADLRKAIPALQFDKACRDTYEWVCNVAAGEIVSDSRVERPPLLTFCSLS